MAELPLDQSIPRFKTNEDRFDNFVNGSPTGGYITSGGTPVPSLRKFLTQKSDYVDAQTTNFLSQKNAEINTAANGILAQASSAKDAAQLAKTDAETARNAAQLAKTGAETAKTQADDVLTLVNNSKDEALAVTKHYFGARTTAPTEQDDGVVLGDEYLDVAITPNQRMTYTASGWRQVAPVALAGYRRQDWTAAADETGPFEVDGGFSSGDVYVNGILIQAGVTLTPGDDGSFIFAAGLTAGDKVAFRGYMTGADADFYTKSETDVALGVLGVRIGTNESDIDSLEATVTDNTDSLNALSSRVNTNENDIQSLATTVSGNTNTLGSLGDAATKNVGTTASTVAAGDDARFAEILKRGVPLGTMVHSAVPLEAQGFLLADGSPCTSVTPDLRAALLAADSPFGNNGVDPLLPDEVTASLFRRAAGGGLTVGTVQGDAIRNITGTYAPYTGVAALRTGTAIATGAFKAGATTISSSVAGSGAAGTDLAFDASLVVPTADENRPKNIAYLPYIKAFGAVTIEGMADAAALFAAITDKTTAEAGLDNTHLMTPLSTKWAIDARKGTTGALALSGAQFDVTGIPEDITAMNMTLSGCAPSAAGQIIALLGTSAGLANTGYVTAAAGQAVSSTSTTGRATDIPLSYTSSTSVIHGTIRFERLGNTNTWSYSGTVTTGANALTNLAGGVTLSAALTRMRLTTAAGTATLSGSIEIEWEK